MKEMCDALVTLHREEVTKCVVLRCVGKTVVAL